MNYKEAVEYIEGAAGQGSKNGLSNMLALLERLGNPHNSWPCVHVAGTNGKGSMCALLSSALIECGHSVGLYISPYLQRYNERIQINGVPVSDGELAEVTTIVAEQVEALRAVDVRPTFFEIGTAVAFLCFARAKVTFAVVEVGMGGRLDVTNVVLPEVSVIGSIGMDHMKVLGDTIPLIAAEKGGIIKLNTPVALYPDLGEAKQTLVDIANGQNAPIWDAADAEISRVECGIWGNRFNVNYNGIYIEGVETPFAGEHQICNAATALAALLALREKRSEITIEAILQGFVAAKWPGRLELFPGTPDVLLDGAHNEPAARALRAAAEKLLADRKIVAVTGIMSNKDYIAVAEHIAAIVSHAVCMAADTPRALPPETLAELYKGLGVPAEASPSLCSAMKRAAEIAGPNGLILVTGSLYVVGEARNLLAPI